MSSKGVITRRRCPLCGHQEVGYTTADGRFHVLEPGTMIQVLPGAEPSAPGGGPKADPMGTVEAGGIDGSHQRVWVPEPLRGDKRLRQKYGVAVNAASFSRAITEEVYASAYLEKLQRLIEKEVHTPIAVILDRAFSAPHLAAGNPRQIAEALWRELDEIRRPARLAGEWLRTGSQESLEAMIRPMTRESLGNQPAREGELRREQEDLTLEEFLELL